VGIGEVALERGGFDGIDGEARQELPVAAERLSVGGEDAATIMPDAVLQTDHSLRYRPGSEPIGLEPS
jgi:hypothetical protein